MQHKFLKRFPGMISNVANLMFEFCKLIEALIKDRMSGYLCIWIFWEDKA